jgi:hypothetical protein
MRMSNRFAEEWEIICAATSISAPSPTVVLGERVSVPETCDGGRWRGNRGKRNHVNAWCNASFLGNDILRASVLTFLRRKMADHVKSATVTMPTTVWH